MIMTNERLGLTAITFGFMGAFIATMLNGIVFGLPADSFGTILPITYVVGMFIGCWKIVKLNDKEYKEYFKIDHASKNLS